MTRFSLLPAPAAQAANAATPANSGQQHQRAARRSRQTSVFVGATVSATLIAFSMVASDGAQARLVYSPNGVTKVDNRHVLVYRGQRYCWYQSAWHGSGWYWCGYAWHRGYGWSGSYGWNYWHGMHTMPYPGWYRERDARSGRAAPLSKREQATSNPNSATDDPPSGSGNNNR